MNRFIYLNLIISILIFLPAVVLAEAIEFKPLVGIPGLNTSNPDVSVYLKALFNISISVAAFLAVIKIIFAGVKYMLTDIVTQKGDAKKDIQAAVLGLLIVIGSVLILQTINPGLTNFNVLQNAKIFSTKLPPSNLGGQTGTFKPGDKMEVALGDTQTGDRVEKECENNGGTIVNRRKQFGDDHAYECLLTDANKAAANINNGSSVEICAPRTGIVFSPLSDKEDIIEKTCNSKSGSLIRSDRSDAGILLCSTVTCIRDDEGNDDEQSSIDEITESINRAECETAGKIFTPSSVLRKFSCSTPPASPISKGTTYNPENDLDGDVLTFDMFKEACAGTARIQIQSTEKIFRCD